MSVVAPEYRDAAGELEENPDYRPLSGMALAGFCLSFITPIAFWHPAGVAIPVLIIVFNLCAIIHISRAGRPTAGRGLALWGLCIALICGGWAGAMFGSQRYILASESQEFAKSWFDFLSRGEPHKAIMLTRTPGTRAPIDDDLWQFFRTELQAQRGLRNYVKEPAVAAVLAIGDKAVVRHYQNNSVEYEDGEHSLTDVYAVSFDVAGERRVVFIELTVVRSYVPLYENYSWKLNEVSILSRPPSSYRPPQ